MKKYFVVAFIAFLFVFCFQVFGFGAEIGGDCISDPCLKGLTGEWEDLDGTDLELEKSILDALKYEQAAKNCRFNPPLKKGISEYFIKLKRHDDDPVVYVNSLAVKKEHIVSQKEFALPKDTSEKINPAKAILTCSLNQIQVRSQAPYSDATTKLLLIWNGKNFAQSAKAETTDESANEVDKALAILKKGDFEGKCPLGDLLYPNQYINNAKVSSLFRESYKSINKKIPKPKSESDFAHLVKRIESLMETAACFTEQVYKAEAEKDKKSGQTRGWGARFGAFSEKQKFIPISDYIGIINDYGFYLQKLNKHVDAIEAFQTVHSLDAQRSVNLLNLADSLWESGKTTDAKNFYNKYIEIMKEAKKENLIPQTAIERSR